MNVDPFDGLADDAGIAAAAQAHADATRAEFRRRVAGEPVPTCAATGCEHPVEGCANPYCCEFRGRMAEVAIEILLLADFLQVEFELNQAEAIKLATDAAGIAASNEA